MPNRRIRLAAVLLAAAVAVSLPAITADAASQLGFVSTIGSFLGFEGPDMTVFETAATDTPGIDAVNSITSLGVAFTENFDSMGNFGTAAVPDGFSINPTGAWSIDTTPNISTTLAYGTTGSGVVTGTSPGGQ
jgi:hypothetical protein